MRRELDDFIDDDLVNVVFRLNNILSLLANDILSLTDQHHHFKCPILAVSSLDNDIRYGIRSKASLSLM